jgi:hypothetical protein
LGKKFEKENMASGLKIYSRFQKKYACQVWSIQWLLWSCFFFVPKSQIPINLAEICIFLKTLTVLNAFFAFWGDSSEFNGNLEYCKTG